MNREKSLEAPTLEEITLGALFHDIGKFAQRAGEEILKPKEMKGLIQKLDPKTGHYTHEHALYTFGVVESLRDYLPPKVRYEIVAQLAASHHAPSDIYQQIIQYGDTISAGVDRKQREYADTDTKDKSKKFFEVPLACVLDSVTFTETPRKPREYCLAPLLPSSIFAQHEVKLSQKEYKNLWISFYKDLKQLKDLEFENYLQALLAVFERYLWCIPSSTMDEPDISLYDHTVTTAAFSVCLYNYYTSHNSTDANQKDLNHQEKAFLFVTGDVSGIQSYIFDLKTTDSNAKLLRARSFEIELLSTQAAEDITDTFKLPKVCVLTNAAGQFLVVLPNTDEVLHTLPDIKLQIERYFFRNFLGELSLNISEPVPACIDDLKLKVFPSLLHKIKDAASKAKQQKFSSVLTSVDSHILAEEYEKIQETGRVCDLCDQRSGEIEKEGGSLCRNCNRLIKIGEKLPKAKAIEQKKEKSMGVEDILLLPACPENPKHHFAYSINNYNPGFGWYHMPYHIPKNDDGIPRTFEELAQQSEGTKKIAMFKADVDNLGMVFSQGLKERMSISRYAALSRTLHYFFSTYLNHFIETKYSSAIYTVFSGGDDVCVLGPWNRILEFAKDFHEEFIRFAGNNPSITISAGISMANPNLPVRMIAHEAEEALKQSKEADPLGREKNRITVFQTTVKWQEYKTLMKEAREILWRYYEDRMISQGFLYRLLNYQEMHYFVTKLQKNIRRNALWLSHFYYDLARNLDAKKYEQESEYLKKFVHENIGNLRIPISYVLYRARKEKEEGGTHE